MQNVKRAEVQLCSEKGRENMNIDITEIIQKKLETMEEEKVIEKAIETTIENTVIKAVEESLESYQLRCAIEEKITKEVSKVAAGIDFQSYNGFIAEKMKEIINETCREDICQKVEKKFKDLFLCQIEEIKLSSIFETYREIACKEVEEQEKWEREEGWHCKCKANKVHDWIECELDYEKKEYRYRADSRISFIVHRDYFDKTKGRILNLYLEGNNFNKTFRFGRLNDVELLLIQAVMNEIPIMVDIEDTADIDNSFDVGY